MIQLTQFINAWPGMHYVTAHTSPRIIHAPTDSFMKLSRKYGKMLRSLIWLPMTKMDLSMKMTYL